MAFVFPEKMNRLDVNNPAASLRTLENYIRYMTERVEFANRTITKQATGAGVSMSEVVQILLDLTSAMSAMQSDINSILRDLGELDELVKVNEDGQVTFTKDVVIDCGEWAGTTEEGGN